MAAFMTKREYVDAIQFDGANAGDVLAWGAGRELDPWEVPRGWSVFKTDFAETPLQIGFPGGTSVCPGGWVIRTENGQRTYFEAMSNRDFTAKYVRTAEA